MVLTAGVPMGTTHKWQFVARFRRGALLERLFEAFQEDAIPYIESLGDDWGEVCASPEVRRAGPGGPGPEGRGTALRRGVPGAQ